MMDIEERLDLVKREVDALQIAAAARDAPWYANTATIISVVALVFSFGTTALSYKRSVDQDIANSRKELREVLQRLVALPKEAAISQKTYAPDPQLNFAVGSFLNQENTFLVAQTAAIMTRLPEGLISAGEYFSLALAYQNAYEVGKAKTYFELARQRAAAASDFNTEVAAIRNIANLEFLVGDPSAGRDGYRMAMDIFDKYPAFDPFTKLSTNVVTQQAWAIAEMNVGRRTEADAHLQVAEAMLGDQPDLPGIVQLRDNVAATRAGIPRMVAP